MDSHFIFIDISYFGPYTSSQCCTSRRRSAHEMRSRESTSNSESTYQTMRRRRGRSGFPPFAAESACQTKMSMGDRLSP